MTQHDSTPHQISRKYIYFFGSFGGILFGYDIGVMTGALPFLQNDWNLTGQAGVIGWITSSLMFGAILGGVLAGQLSDRLGRRTMILFSAALFMVFSLICAISPHNGWVFLGFSRVFLGLAVGAASALVPAYMSEMAPAGVRGRLSGLNQTMIVSGMLLSYVCAWFLQELPETWAWRSMLALAAMPALILFVGVLRLPESPRFLMIKGQSDKARAVLAMIRDEHEVEKEFEVIKGIVEQEKEIAESAPSESHPFSHKYRYLLIAGVGVAAFQQFQGANAIFYYIPLIVSSASGTDATNALIWPIVQGVILVLGSLVFMAIADKFNRKTLLVLGGTVMGLSFLFPSVINAVADANPMLIVVFLSIYVAFYSFTWAPLTWVIVGEIFPLKIRGKAAGLASSLNWIGSFSVGLLFPIMTASMSQEAVFAIFGVICLLGVAFVITRVPETQGRSLEEIETAYTSRT